MKVSKIELQIAGSTVGNLTNVRNGIVANLKEQGISQTKVDEVHAYVNIENGKAIVYYTDNNEVNGSFELA